MNWFIVLIWIVSWSGVARGLATGWMPATAMRSGPRIYRSQSPRVFWLMIVTGILLPFLFLLAFHFGR